MREWNMKGLALRLIGSLCALSMLAGAARASTCPDVQANPVIPRDLAVCRALDKAVREPGKLPLHVYEQKLEAYLRNFCHRDEAAGWRADKHVRDTGPFVPSDKAGTAGRAFGTHKPVVVWYSPEMIAWLKTNRHEGVEATADREQQIPDGAIMVKEMFSVPASLCADVDVKKLMPKFGAAVMVRDNETSHDGWFWGWFGWAVEDGKFEWEPDWPAKVTSPYPNMGFGQYCVNCHASARANQTFSTLRNIEGEPGQPLVYFSDGQVVDAGDPSQHETVTEVHDPKPKALDPGDAARFASAIGLGAFTLPKLVEVKSMPPATYDNVWAHPKGKGHTEFVTSDQCIGCHDAGGTGLQFDMTKRLSGDRFVNESPYATWRSSPMGMAGRDPIFFAQLASETETFHPKNRALVEDVCLGCHGVLGQRAFRAKSKRDGGECLTMERAGLNVTPFPDGRDPVAELADYAGLSRDGVSCVVCHRMALGPAAQTHHGEPQNACLDERRKLLTPGLTSFAAAFTGSFDLGPADKLNGPFEHPAEKPMKNALGMAPVYDKNVQSSELCGTCHTVHLPIIENGGIVGYTYEQTTYAEWAFSAYRTGVTPAGALPSGKGEMGQSCQACHMPSADAAKHPFRSKIASIQEYSNFPQTENNLGPEDIDLKVRDGFAKHTLVGLNTIFMEMAQQFPDLLGVRVKDPMLNDPLFPTKPPLEPMAVTKNAMLEQASRTADVAVTDIKKDGGVLDVTVKVTNHTGHKFPSGVGFRRAFLEFTVRDVAGQVIWASGRTNKAGVILDGHEKPLVGEYWWKLDCSGYLDPNGQGHQPHFRVITREDQAQIYEDLAAAPAPGAGPEACTRDAKRGEHLTTSFLSRCTKVKDNRLLPTGYLDLEARKAIAEKLGAKDDLAEEAGAYGVAGDPDYEKGGGHTLHYRVPLAGMAAPAVVEATLYYQPTPPYYLQDRACTSKSDDTKRLMFIAANLNLDLGQGRTANWKLKVAGSGRKAVP